MATVRDGGSTRKPPVADLEPWARLQEGPVRGGVVRCRVTVMVDLWERPQGPAAGRRWSVRPWPGDSPRRPARGSHAACEPGPGPRAVRYSQQCCCVTVKIQGRELDGRKASRGQWCCRAGAHVGFYFTPDFPLTQEKPFLFWGKRPRAKLCPWSAVPGTFPSATVSRLCVRGLSFPAG